MVLGSITSLGVSQVRRKVHGLHENKWKSNRLRGNTGEIDMGENCALGTVQYKTMEL